MNRLRFVVDELDVEAPLLRDVLRCMLHTLVFQRAFGLIVPIDAHVDILELSYAKCDDREIDTKVESDLSNVAAMLKKKPLSKAQFMVTFYEKRKEKAWFGTSEKRVAWEEWQLSFNVLSSATGELSEERRALLEAEVRARLVAVLKKVNDNKNHIPPLTTKESVPFPWDLVLLNVAQPTDSASAAANATNASGLFGGMLDMLKQGASPLGTSPPSAP